MTTSVTSQPLVDYYDLLAIDRDRIEREATSE